MSVPAAVEILECRDEFRITESQVYLKFSIGPADLKTLLADTRFKETRNHQPWNSGTTTQPYTAENFTADRVFWSGGLSSEGYVLYYDTGRQMAVCYRMSIG